MKLSTLGILPVLGGSEAVNKHPMRVCSWHGIASGVKSSDIH
jgi:hypothetical protein